MVLVDFKGGATFAGLSDMPHVSAVITNLEDELTLVDRMQDALSGEMVRRQELLREAGNYASVRDYEKARASGEPPRPAAQPVHRRRRVLRDALGQARVHRPVRGHRPARPLARPAPAARLAAARGGPAARAREPPVLPDRPAHVLQRRVARRPRRAGRLRAAPGPGPRLPQARPVHAAALQGRLRLRAAAAPQRCRRGPVRRPGAQHPAVHRRPRAPPARGRAGDRRGRRAGDAPRPPTAGRCSTSPSTGWSATGPRRTRSGCRRSTCRTPSTR